jgi:DNA-binding beta-propeller fold protein YncE
MQLAPAVIALGTEFAGHRIEGELGRGGMGVVYRAHHLALDLTRALKVISPSLSSDPSYVERFRRECRLAASVDHPAVIAVHHAGEERGLLYMSMQFIDGFDLGRLLAEGPLPPGRCVALLRQIAAGLDAAHDAGLIHRDVKPENVLVSEAPTGEAAHLTDFGIGTLAEAAERATSRASRGIVLGTSDYVAPEQVAGEVIDSRADIYSLACVAFHMLTGEPPFSQLSDLAKLAAHGSSPRPLASSIKTDLDPAVDDVLARGMAIDPDGRPARAGQLSAAVEDALLRSGQAAVPTRELSSPTGSRRRVRWTWVAAIGFVIAAALAVALATAIGGSEDGDGGGEVPRLAVASSIDTPRDPVDVSAVNDLVWVAGRRSQRVVALRPDGHRALGFGLDLDYPRSLVHGFGHVWAATWDGLVRIDPTTGRQDGVVSLGKTTDVAVDRDHVWVLTRDAQQTSVVQVDPRSLKVTGKGFVGDDARAVAAGAGAVWVTNTADGSISEIDRESGRTVGRPLEIGGRPTDVAAGGGSVWVVDNFQGRLVRIDLHGAGAFATVDRTIDTAPHPRGVASGFGSVWVSLGDEDLVARYDRSGDLTATYEVGGDPASVDTGDGSVWIADQASDTVSRIDPGQ